MKLSKRAIDVSTLDPKINNRLQEIRKVLQQADYLKKQINDQVGDLLKKQAELEKRIGMFNNELLPLLKQLQDHAITAEGIYVALKKGHRSPKIGYDFLATRVNSQLLALAEEAMSKTAEFAQAPSFTLSEPPAASNVTPAVPITSSLSKRFASAKDWIAKKWHELVDFVKSFGARLNKVGKDIEELHNLTLPTTNFSRGSRLSR